MFTVHVVKNCCLLCVLVLIARIINVQGLDVMKVQHFHFCYHYNISAEYVRQGFIDSTYQGIYRDETCHNLTIFANNESIELFVMKPGSAELTMFADDIQLYITESKPHLLFSGRATNIKLSTNSTASRMRLPVLYFNIKGKLPPRGKFLKTTKQRFDVMNAYDNCQNERMMGVRFKDSCDIADIAVITDYEVLSVKTSLNSDNSNKDHCATPISRLDLISKFYRRQTLNHIEIEVEPKREKFNLDLNAKTEPILIPNAIEYVCLPEMFPYFTAVHDMRDDDHIQIHKATSGWIVVESAEHSDQLLTEVIENPKGLQIEIYVVDFPYHSETAFIEVSYGKKQMKTHVPDNHRTEPLRFLLYNESVTDIELKVKLDANAGECRFFFEAYDTMNSDVLCDRVNSENCQNMTDHNGEISNNVELQMLTIRRTKGLIILQLFVVLIMIFAGAFVTTYFVRVLLMIRKQSNMQHWIEENGDNAVL